MSSTARAKVLETNELLEKILWFLPFRDLLMAQQLNKHYKSVVERSPQIQKKLYRAPMQKGETLYHPLMDTIFNSIPIRSLPSIKDQARKDLRSSFLSVADLDTKDGERILAALYLPKDQLKNKAISNGTKQSWGSMFITQPPVKCLRAMAINKYGRYQGVDAKVQVDGGIRFADLVEKAEQWRKREDRRIIWSGVLFFVLDEDGE